MRMIKCGDGGLAPAVVVCVHLIEGESHEWRPMPSSDSEMDHDWLCPECYARPGSLGIDDIQLVCMHCANEMREQSRQLLEAFNPKSICLLYCLGVLEELKRLGFAEGDGTDRLSERGTAIFKELAAAGFEHAPDETLACLTELSGTEEAAQLLVDIIKKLKDEGWTP